jgi:hypothetical protein
VARRERQLVALVAGVVRGDLGLDVAVGREDREPRQDLAGDRQLEALRLVLADLDRTVRVVGIGGQAALQLEAEQRQGGQRLAAGELLLQADLVLLALGRAEGPR